MAMHDTQSYEINTQKFELKTNNIGIDGNIDTNAQHTEHKNRILFCKIFVNIYYNK